MEQGSILFHKSFKFHDGERGTKLLVILNNPDLSQNEPYIVAKTTSNPLKGSTRFGCSNDASTFHIPANHDFFEKDTWIILYDLYEAETNSLLQDKFNGECDIKGKLAHQTIKLLIDCVRESQDVEVAYKKLILRKD